MKSRKKRIEKKKKLIAKRTRKKLKEKKKGKVKIKGNVIFKFNYELAKKPIFKIFEENHFYKKADIFNNTAYIEIPEKFSFNENPYETINVIKEIAYAVKKQCNIWLNHENCKEIDLAASLVMDTIIMEYSNVCKKIKLNSTCGGKLSNCSKVNDILRFSGILHNLNIEKRKTNSRFELLPLSKNEESGIMSTKIIDYYSKCLKTKGYSLTEEGKICFSKLIGEVVNNCPEHGGKNVQWYALGHFIKEDGECNLTIFDFGDTIYEGMKNNSVDSKTIQRLKEMTEPHKKIFHQVDEELLWTLFSLQHGISRLNSDEDATRGQGTIDLIDNFQNLGCKYDEKGNFKKPIMSITSGNINILFDGTYTIKENESNLKVIAFNEDNDLSKKPDERYVRNIKNYFPGTVISIRFFIDRKYIEELKSNA